MDSIRIDTGVKRIMINDDPNNVIEFNPGDVSFAEGFQGLISEFEMKMVEYQRRSDEIEANNELDEHGIPSNLEARLKLMREVCEFIREKIDHIFGVGTSQKLFGNALSLDMFTQFFEQITPFIQRDRLAKVAKYQKKPQRKQVMK
ncbi:MAG: DUF6673 family protein [Pseudomonadota bacterium]